MVKYTWFKEKVPDNLKVQQVYGIAFTDDKRVLLRIDDDKYELTGGKPENGEIYEETLKREYLEEASTFIEDIYYLGYLLVDDNNEQYAQVRMIAKIRNINTNHMDPMTARMYERKLVSIDNLKKYLNYSGMAGNIMLDDAIDMANKVYEFSSQNGLEEFV